MHPQIIGRPGRLRMLDDFIDFVSGTPGVDVARARDVASRARRMLAAEG